MQENLNEILEGKETETPAESVELNDEAGERAGSNAEEAEQDKTLEKPKRVRRTKKVPASEEDVPVETDDVDTVQEEGQKQEVQTESTGRLRSRNAVISIDGGRSELTSEAKMRSDLIDLSESLRNRKILTGIIQGVESVGGSSIPAYAVLYHGAFKIVIPVEELVKLPEDAAPEYLSAVVTRRLGAEIEFIIKGIDQKSMIAAASRVDAMQIRRREFFLRKNEDGQALLGVDSIAEGRIVCVLPSGVFVELFGVEAFVPRSELSAIRMSNALDYFSTGQRVLVKILEIDVSDPSDIKLELSLRRAKEDEILRSLERFLPGNLYAGVVSMISPVGIFVTMDDVVTCLCSFPPRSRPIVGTQVCVRIRGVDMERKRLWGLIIR